VSRPNSRLTRVRRKLARQIAPGPAAGEGWCVDCALNQGRTLVLSADGTTGHVQWHREQEPDGRMHVQTAWPARAGEKR
jgi:hypothetical protein